MNKPAKDIFEVTRNHGEKCENWILHNIFDMNRYPKKENRNWLCFRTNVFPLTWLSWSCAIGRGVSARSIGRPDRTRGRFRTKTFLEALFKPCNLHIIKSWTRVRLTDITSPTAFVRHRYLLHFYSNWHHLRSNFLTSSILLLNSPTSSFNCQYSVD
jgi:hypothetical protein